MVGLLRRAQRWFEPVRIAGLLLADAWLTLWDETWAPDDDDYPRDWR